MYFNEELIILGLEASDAREVIQALAIKLENQGCVTKEYCEFAWEREKKFPTGLPTSPFAIAIPHADAEGVLQSSIAIATLAKPVRFMNMADPEMSLDAEIVFLMATKDPETQVTTLQRLATFFGDQDELINIKNQSSVRACYDCFLQVLEQECDLS